MDATGGTGATRARGGTQRYPALRMYVGIAIAVSWIVGGLCVVGAFGDMAAAHNSGAVALLLVLGFVLWLLIRVGADFCSAVADIADNTRRLADRTPD